MAEVAFVFPGQGSQSAGMGRELAAAYPESLRVFDEADDVLGLPLKKLIFEGPDSELALTQNTQPAVLATSIAALAALEPRGMKPSMVAGHSLGEYSALVAAGALSFADALRLVRNRGLYMQEAVPVGAGAMAAIIGLEASLVEELCREAARDESVSAVNYNSPDQTVIAGHANGVKRAIALAEARGARRAMLLPVSAPFHSSLMAPARERLEPNLLKTQFSDARVPVVTNVDAEPNTSGSKAREALVRQVDSPVRWVASVERMRDEGIGLFVEIGPGKVLTGLARRIDKSLQAVSVSDTAGIDKLVEKLAGEA